ncbi:hypothetical protein SDC9_185965 [bioreactor metagenome]|uniref:Uncharacterized protein n=1 Tax=bioreactor metagenome TaxID=1076179 RepID=A0A645HHE0_9ZZZZ
MIAYKNGRAVPYHIKSALEVGMNNIIKIRLFHQSHEAVAGDAGIVYKDIDRAEVGLYGRNGLFGLLKIGYVAAVGQGFHAELIGAFLADRLRGFAVARENHGDICAEGCKLFGNRRADAA